MTSIPLNFNNIQIQLKARLRVPILLASKKMNSEFAKNLNPALSNEINLLSFSQTKLNKPNIDSFSNYSLKINLLKKLLLNMSIKDLYQEEKECSERYKEVISEITTKKTHLELQNLPLLKPQKKFIQKKIKLKKIKFQVEPIKKIISKTNITPYYQKNPCLSSTNRITSSLESTKEKEIKKNKNLSSTNIDINDILNPKAIFNQRRNFSLIRGGGVKYNNSIFRYKSMNDLLHY